MENDNDKQVVNESEAEDTQEENGKTSKEEGEEEVTE